MKHSVVSPSRRKLMIAAAGLVFQGAPFGVSSTGQAAASNDITSLRQVAGKKGLVFGAEVTQKQISTDPAYAAIVGQQAGMIVPGLELKWHMLRPGPDSFNFEPAEWLYRFARTNGQLFRGHTLVWDEALPPWFRAYITPKNARILLERHIGTVVGRFSGRVHSWDVVNEVIDPHENDDLKVTPWKQNLGPDYVEMAFRIARTADPQALLVLNEVRLEPEKPMSQARRDAVLRLLTKLKKSGVPIDALGIQSHLWDKPVANWKPWESFLRDVSSLGLKIFLTELDLRASQPDKSHQELQKAIADQCYGYLSSCLQVQATKLVVAWDMSSKYSWLKSAARGAEIGLPYDDVLNPTPMLDALTRAFQGASPR